MSRIHSAFSESDRPDRAGRADFVLRQEPEEEEEEDGKEDEDDDEEDDGYSE